METDLILILLQIIIVFFIFRISKDIKRGFKSLKSRQDYIENKIDDLK